MKKALLTRFSSIGDIILTTPVIRAIAQQLPNTKIHFATKASYISLLEHNPYISELIPLHDDFGKLVDKLQATRYDYFIDLHKNLRTLTLKKKLQYGQYITYSKDNWKKSLLVNFRMNRLSGKHNVERYFDALQTLGLQYDGQGYDFFMPGDFTPSEQLQNLLSSPYVTYAIGGKQKTKKLPMQRIADLCSKITLPVVLIGGKDETAEGETIAKQLSHVTNLSGSLNLYESAWIMQNANKVICHDTGMMHLACALNKPLSVIWGNTVPDFGFAPLFSDASETDLLMVEHPNLSCRPCSRHGKNECPKGHFNCMMELDLSELVQWINQPLR